MNSSALESRDHGLEITTLSIRDLHLMKVRDRNVNNDTLPTRTSYATNIFYRASAC